MIDQSLDTHRLTRRGSSGYAEGKNDGDDGERLFQRVLGVTRALECITRASPLLLGLNGGTIRQREVVVALALA